MGNRTTVNVTTPPSQIAVDVSPERAGKSPEQEIQRWLEAHGYTVRARGAVLFAVNRSAQAAQILS